MAYTVKKVARISGVSVRTLHFYDEIGLLKPAYHAANGYRFYEEAELLLLQQILFYRELGFDLRRIREIVSRKDFDRLAALKSHRKVLRQNLAHTAKLIATIDQTIEHLKGKKMKTEKFFAGFDPEQQAKHEQYLIDRFGAGMKTAIAQTKKKVEHWTKADWQESGAVFERICTDLVNLLKGHAAAESVEVQEVIGRHHRWLSQFWTPNAQSYAAHTQLIVDSDLRKAYEKFDAGLPEFAAAAIKRYAATQLT